MKFWIIFKLPHETAWFTTSTNTKEKMDDFIKCITQSGFEARFSHTTHEWDRQKDAVQYDMFDYHQEAILSGYC